MSDPRDYKLDLSSAGVPRVACCGVYQRIYRSPDGTRYEGHCPKCAKPVRFKVGAGGTDARFFVVE